MVRVEIHVCDGTGDGEADGGEPSGLPLSSAGAEPVEDEVPAASRMPFPRRYGASGYAAL